MSVTTERAQSKTLLVVDKPARAFDILVDEIIRHLGGRFDLSKAYKPERSSKEVIRGFDLINSFRWGRYPSEPVQQHVGEEEQSACIGASDKFKEVEGL